MLVVAVCFRIFAVSPAFFICGAKVSEASAPAVVADGQIALASGLSYPQGVAISPTGTVYVADTGNNRVVTVSNKGVVTPVKSNYRLIALSSSRPIKPSITLTRLR